jgi:hypothetical protein
MFKIGERVKVGVYVCGEWRSMHTAVVVRTIDSQLIEVDRMSLHGGAPWLSIEQISHCRSVENGIV